MEYPIIKQKNHFPIYIVMVNKSDSKYCRSKSMAHWREWTGIFYDYTAEECEDHIVNEFLLGRNKKLVFAMFVKEEQLGRWEFVKRIR